SCYTAYGSPPPLHSFPTRRSSDLSTEDSRPPLVRTCHATIPPPSTAPSSFPTRGPCAATSVSATAVSPPSPIRSPPPTRPSSSRSEEHTSELQSRGHLVCRLLLEK